MKICEEPRFVEVFKMIRGFCLKWTGSCRNKNKVTSFSTKNTNFGKKALIEMQSNCSESYSRWNFSISSLDLELVKKKTNVS